MVVTAFVSLSQPEIFYRHPCPFFKRTQFGFWMIGRARFRSLFLYEVFRVLFPHKGGSTKPFISVFIPNLSAVRRTTRGFFSYKVGISSNSHSFPSSLWKRRFWVREACLVFTLASPIFYFLSVHSFGFQPKRSLAHQHFPQVFRGYGI